MYNFAPPEPLPVPQSGIEIGFRLTVEPTSTLSHVSSAVNTGDDVNVSRELGLAEQRTLFVELEGLEGDDEGNTDGEWLGVWDGWGHDNDNDED